MSQRNTPDTLHWLKGQHDSGSTAWRAFCLGLCRSARNLPGVFPSAFAAEQGTPMSDRVFDRDKWQAGMVVFIDDPRDGNPFGHIATLRTRLKNGDWLVWTNDAFVRGGVSCVSVDWFKPHWGDSVQFAATSLNGFDLILPRPAQPKHPKPAPKKKATPDNLNYAIHRLEKSRDWHKAHNHPLYVKRLTQEIQHITNIKEGKLG